ncbi:MAG: sortase [Propionibacteriales bacterium]|nr:sortase [Propionibacteriales bacterium]
MGGGTADPTGPHVADSAAAGSAAVADGRGAPPTPEVERATRPGEPQEILIPRLDLRAPFVAVEAEGEVLPPPSDPATVGWWAGGVSPGASRGAAVVAGHTVQGGGGVFDDLHELQGDDEVVVRIDGRDLQYRVASLTTYSKDELAANAADLFDQRGPSRLVLVTCRDWDGDAFRSNEVVIAVPAG